MLLLSCEHGGNRVPRAYAKLFATGPAKSALAGHRGVDLGALEVARALSRRLEIPLVATTVTRLLVDANRSPGHPKLFSEFAKSLSRADRETLVARHYRPHRERVYAEIDKLSPRRVVHIAVHSFTPVLDGVRRNADIGLLYDPRREPERRLCDRWAAALRGLDPTLRVRRNYPYRGTSDGLTTALRRDYPPARYAGIELEINQVSLTTATQRRRITDTLTASLTELFR